MSQNDNANKTGQNPDNDQSTKLRFENPVTTVQKAEKPQLRTGAKPMALVPQTIEEAARIAQAYTMAGMAPRSYVVEDEVRMPDGSMQKVINNQATQGRILIGILKGMDIGMTPTQAMSTIYIVNNIPTVYGDGIVALMQNSGDYEWHKNTFTGTPKTDQWTATCTIKKRGRDDLIEASFTWAQAKAAGLTAKRGPWSQYPERQMMWRALGWAAREGFAKELAGLGIAEEIHDIPADEPKPVNVASQQDEFTMKALGNDPAPAVDYGLMGKKTEAEPVTVQKLDTTESAQVQVDTQPAASFADSVAEQFDQAMADDQEESPQDAPGEAETEIVTQGQDEPEDKQPAPENTALACVVCNGRKIVEDDDGKGPCTAC